MSDVIVVTGASGMLGRELVPRLVNAGLQVRAVSHHRAGTEDGVEWVHADLVTGSGLAEALTGAATVVHLAQDAGKHAREVNVEGTRALLRAARDAGVAHAVYPSIVGQEQMPMAYFRTKVEAAEIVRSSGVPWTILTATQFHPYVDKTLRGMARGPVAVIPTGFLIQPLDAGEFAARMCDAVTAGPSGQLPDIGGPEAHRLDELARVWLHTQRRRALIVPLPLPGKLAAAMRHGAATTPDRVGTITWSDWVDRTYRPSGNAEGTTAHATI